MLLWVQDHFLSSLASETDYTAQKREKKTLIKMHGMICGEVYVNQRCVCGCSLFHGKVDYMKKGATNKQKLKELRLTELRRC